MRSTAVLQSTLPRRHHTAPQGPFRDQRARTQALRSSLRKPRSPLPPPDTAEAGSTSARRLSPQPRPASRQPRPAVARAPSTGHSRLAWISMLPSTRKRLLESIGDDDVVLDIGGWADPFER